VAGMAFFHQAAQTASRDTHSSSPLWYLGILARASSRT